MNRKRIIIPLHRTDLNQLRQLLTVCDNYARKNTDTLFELLHCNTTAVSADDIRNEKTAAALEKNNQLVVSDKSTGTYAGTEAGQVWIINPESIHLLAPAREWLQKNPVTGNSAYIMYAGQDKMPVADKLRNYFRQLIAGQGAGAELLVINAEMFETIAPAVYANTDDTLFDAIYATGKSGYTLQPLKVSSPKKRASGSGILAYTKQRISTFISWNIRVPVKQISSGRIETPITSGKHPFYRLAFVVVAAFLLFAIPYLSFDYGMIWDEKSENEYSKDVLNYYLTSGKDTSCFDTSKPLYSHQINYGTFINLTATVANRYFSPFGEYETRHVIVALLSALGMIFTGRIARKLTNNPALGLMAMLFLMLSPHYFGQGMNNHKDIPFAAGYIISIYYLICFLQQLPRPSSSLITKLTLAFGFTISVRIGGLLLIAYLVLFVGLYWLHYMRQNGTAKAFALFRKLLLPIFVISAASYFIGILFWPWGMRAPLTNPIKALTEFTQYSNIKNYELFEGKVLFMSDKPWYYLPKHLFINTPLYIWLGLGLAIALVPALIKRYNIRLSGVLLFVAAFPIAYAVYKHSNLYNGWRQFIFTYPPLVVLSALGYGTLLSLSAAKVYRFAITGFIVLNLGYIAAWIVQNHPQQYVYFNETAGGNKGAYGNYELDYYSNSCREAAEWIANQNPGKKLLVAINNEPLTASYYSSRINPDMNVQWVREYEEQKMNWDYLILTTRTFSKNELVNGSYPPKGTVYEVTSGGAPICVVVKRENTFMPDGYKALEAKQADSAIWNFTQAVAYNPKDEEALRMLGYTYLAAGAYDSAEIFINKAIEIFPENYSAYHNKGMIYMSRKDLNKAIELFDKATKLKINHVESYYYAASCEMQQNNFEAAIIHLKKAIEQNSGVPEFYYNLGVAYYNTGNFKKAEESLTMCLSLNPSNAMGYRLLSEVFTKQNKPQEAQFCMNKYRELGGQ
jgi:tetratricopeptide (TPR) repeat protein